MNSKMSGVTASNQLCLRPCCLILLSCLAALTLGAGSVIAQGTAKANTARDGETATIISTQYGSLPPYRITVSPSGEITSTIQAHGRVKALVRTDQMTAFNQHRFFRDLAKAGRLNTLPVGIGQVPAPNRRGRRRQYRPSAGMVSLPGPQIYVLYQGQHTPNLRLASSNAGQVLYQDVRKIMQVLRMPVPNYP